MIVFDTNIFLKFVMKLRTVASGHGVSATVVAAAIYSQPEAGTCIVQLLLQTVPHGIESTTGSESSFGFTLSRTESWSPSSMFCAQGEACEQRSAVIEADITFTQYVLVDNVSHFSLRKVGFIDCDDLKIVVVQVRRTNSNTVAKIEEGVPRKSVYMST